MARSIVARPASIAARTTLFAEADAKGTRRPAVKNRRGRSGLHVGYATAAYLAVDDLAVDDLATPWIA